MQKLFSVLNRVLLLGLCLTLAPLKSSAQVIPDNTLGVESSQIRSIGDLRDAIEGGAIRGENLFHSFQEFSISKGMSVDFANPEGIANIFSRVTGNNISEIFGSLGVNGAANLFLINPNGIVFGENAVINIGGSFLATTAESIEFKDAVSFSASDSQSDPTLTIDFPIGLGFGANPGNITIDDEGHSLFFSAVEPIATERNSISPGLQVNSQNNLALLGGEVNLNGGVLIAEEGKIELGGVKQGFVGLTTDSATGEWQFDYAKVSDFGDINLTNRSWVDASNILPNTGDSFDSKIRIFGKNITAKDESAIFVQNLSGDTVGDVKLDATESIVLSKIEISPVSQIPGTVISETVGATSSNIYLNAPQISLLDGGGIISRTFGPEKSSDISIEASDKLELSGISAEDLPPVPSSILNTAYPAGATGITNVKTPLLSIKDGASISNFVAVQATGNPINIEADTINLSGADSVSGVFASSISSTSSDLSQGADIKISASNIKIKQGATIASSSGDFGKLGVVEINASDSLKIEGFNLQTLAPSNISSIVLTPSEAARELFAEIDVELMNPTTGNSGDLNINTPLIKVTNNASINVSNAGTGNAGNLTINANSISLDSGGEISASTLSGQGGNIDINTENLEILSQSQITASAGGQGDGGNITIDSDTVLGLENSDITANAVGGDGGNIAIDSDFIVGSEARSRLTQFSDITASSELGIDGTVTVNAPDNNLGEDAVVVFTNYTRDKDRRLLKRICLNPRNSENGRLIYVGRGGIPENPRNFFGGEEVAAIEKVPTEEQTRENGDALWVEGDPIVNSNAVRVGADGEQYLVAETKSEDVDSSICSTNSKVNNRSKTDRSN